MQSKMPPKKLTIHKGQSVGWTSEICRKLQVLDAFDKLERQEKRQQLDLKSAVERESRNRL